ncbi:MAG TPA: acetyl-CoA carboxylase biotin carboxyl carrier protein [Candidatus Thermoplasmatota archaeon]|jgi:acetyl-CoA carboxylase biotin carboxyl carrier protein
MIDFGFLERLLDLLHRSDAQSIEIRKWTTTIRISKGPLSNTGQPVTYQVAAPPPVVGPAGAAPGAVSEGAAAGGGGSAPGKVTLVDIKSPMVGTFYAQPEPGAEPYVRVGSRVSPGQTLCIIEAMKIMNPLDSEVTGVIREVLVEDTQPVEFGQVLFRVDPHG